MKIKISIFALMFFACTSSLFAQQQRRTVEERVKMTVTRMTDSLNLDKSQAERTSVAMTDFYNSMEKMREGLAPGTRPERSDMEKMMKMRDEKLSQILTKEQMERFKAMEERMRAERMQRQ